MLHVEEPKSVLAEHAACNIVASTAALCRINMDGKRLPDLAASAPRNQNKVHFRSNLDSSYSNAKQGLPPVV